MGKELIMGRLRASTSTRRRRGGFTNSASVGDSGPIMAKAFVRKLRNVKLIAVAILTAALLPAGAQAADVVSYYHLDSVGNVLAVTNQSGAVTETHDYLPFGEEWCGTAVCGTVTAGQPKRFTGKERDAETGLDYFGARYYGSKIGRFTTTDPE